MVADFVPALWILLALLPVVLFELRGDTRRNSTPLSDVELMRGHVGRSAWGKKIYRAAVLTILAVLLGVLWSGPTLQTLLPVLSTDTAARQKNLMFAIDVSRSMSGPLETPDSAARFANYGQAPTSDATQQTRYGAARETVYRFVERFPEARIGLILFSTEPFLARWPTTETGNRFVEVLDENLAELSQLRRFSGLTNTDAAMQLARQVFAELGQSQGGAVILISDAEDEFEKMGLAIRALRADGIRLYTIGVGIAESVIVKLADEFAGDTGFRVFRVDSEQEMQEAYQLVSDLEASPQYADGEQAYVMHLNWLLALVLAAYFVLMVWQMEILMPRTPMAHPVNRRVS